MATIDELIVRLTLQPQGWEAGRAKSKATLQDMKRDASELENAILAIRRNSTEKMTPEGQRRLRLMRAELAQQKKLIKDADQVQKTADQDDAKRKKAQGQRNKELGEGVGAVTNKLLGLAAAFGVSVGLKDFISSTITGNANLGRLATTLGVSTEELSAWEGAVRQVGGTTEDAAAAIGLLVQSAQQVKLTGWSPIVPLLIREGISPADLENPIKAYGELADKFHAMDPRQAAALGAMFNIPPSVVNLLIKGRVAMEAAMAAEAKAYSVHKADADAAQKAQREISLLKDSYGRLGANLLNEVLPPLINVGDKLRDFAETDWSKTQYAGQFKQISTDADAANDALVRFEKTVGIDLGPAVRNGFSVVLTWIDDTLREIAHLASAMDDAAHGKWAQAGAEAWAAIRESAAGDLASRLTGHGPASPAPLAAPGAGPVTPRPGETSAGLAVRQIAQFEGYRSKAYWDRNAYRVGFGSDTVTDAKTGAVSRVTAETAGVTRESAAADLVRRVNTEFAPSVIKAVGLPTWDKLPQPTRAALISVDYNYGHLPKPVLAAARTGDTAKIAEAISALQIDNGGLNRGRRIQEAALAQTPPATEKPALPTPSERQPPPPRPPVPPEPRARLILVDGEPGPPAAQQVIAPTPEFPGLRPAPASRPLAPPRPPLPPPIHIPAPPSRERVARAPAPNVITHHHHAARSPAAVRHGDVHHHTTHHHRAPGAPAAQIHPAVTVAPQLIASAPAQAASNSTVTNHHQTVNVGGVTVHTKATDGSGVARDIAPALSREMAVQANNGLG